MKYRFFTTKQQAAFCATKTLRQIADETGRTIYSVRHHAHHHGLPYKPERPRRTPEEIIKATELFNNGIGPAEAARRLNRGTTWVKSVFKSLRNERERQ